MTDPRIIKPLDVAGLIRDSVAVAGVLALSIGTGLQFGIGYGLMMFGALCLALIFVGSFRK